MSPWHAIAIFAAGIFAGTINTIIGSGTLVTFPVLLGFGYAPVVANVSNTVGLVPGFVSGTVGYRRELSGQRARLTSLAGASVTGSVIGAVLLLSLPATAFGAVVPAFIAIAVLLILLQPRLSRRLSSPRPRARARVGPIPTLGVLIGGIYGGYFGAAQGILVLAVLGLSVEDDLQRLNALKVVLTG
ncbi:MAG: sulfite exporter TauE/SafE family protein, partial [Solirubrobacteraceae bacterium]